MSGHSKWHSIKHKKAATDAKKGKIFTKHAKLVAIAARKGGDPFTNPALRAAIDNAKAENMPVDNIERAIKKGTGEGKDAAQFSEVIYEARGPAGVALLIEALTDNKNRTVSDLKTLLTKQGAALGAAGAVAYLFQRKGLITAPLKAVEDPESKKAPPPPQTKTPDEIELAAIDAGADDVRIIGPTDSNGSINSPDEIEIYTDPSALMQVRSALNTAGVKTGKAVLTYIPTQEVEVADEATAQKVFDLIEAIEDLDDVNTVYHNMK